MTLSQETNGAEGVPSPRAEDSSATKLRTKAQDATQADKTRTNLTKKVTSRLSKALTRSLSRHEDLSSVPRHGHKICKLGRR